MPMYPIVCKCGHKSEQFARVRGRNRIRCPECRKVAAIDWPQLTGINDANHSFSGTAGVMRGESFPKRSVAKARALFGNDLANCIKDDGRVVVKDSRQSLEYFKRRREIQKQCRYKRGEDPDYLPPD